ncbi:MAG TPA: ATPase, T2SS/T4P/T4SS family [Cellvibrionaceae bacterium]
MLPYLFAKKNRVLLTEEPGGGKLYVTSNTPDHIFSEINRKYKKHFPHERIDNAQFEVLLHSAYEAYSVSAHTSAAAAEQHADITRLGDEIASIADDLLDDSGNSPIIKFINAIISDAIKSSASDIHIESYESRLAIRYRIDGILKTVAEPKPQLAPMLISRLKVMAKLDIAEKRVPQDGRISLRLANREVDIRVSTLPATTFERTVLRILDKSQGLLDLQHIGIHKDQIDLIQSLLKTPHGILLITGPTGSGKSTTLYACLNSIKDDTRNILAVEDPVEYQVDGIGQTQVNEKSGLTFARGLRAILRQDPDVIMVGEIRDAETLDIAIQAGLTGHMVLSTLHTNSTLGAITRMLDMGAEAYLIGSSLVGVVAQRLVRRLCQNCRTSPDDAFIIQSRIKYQFEFSALYEACGCEQCQFTGYKGRLALIEVLPIDRQLRKAIAQQQSEEELRLYVGKNYLSLLHDGFRKVSSGDTSLDEVLRVTQRSVDI